MSGFKKIMTARAACAVLGITPKCSHCEARRAYHIQLLKAHPDKGGCPEAFSRVQRAWDIFALGNLDPMVRNSQSGMKAGNFPAKLAARSRRVQTRNSSSVKQRPAGPRLSTIRLQRARSALFKSSKQGHDDLLDMWCREALLSVKKPQPLMEVTPACDPSGAVAAASSHCAVTPASASTSAMPVESTSPRPAGLCSGISVDRGGTKRLVGGGHLVPRCTGKARKHGDRKGSREKDSQRRECSSKTGSQCATGHALEKHIQAERAAMAAAKGNGGQIAKLRCPMLARHLRDERAAAAAAAVEHELEQQKQEQQQQQQQQQQQPNLADLATATRAMPREERRRFLMELPKATRLALEAHVLAERKVSGSRLNSNSMLSRGEVPQSSACGQSETTKVSDFPPVCGRP